MQNLFPYLNLFSIVHFDSYLNQNLQILKGVQFFTAANVRPRRSYTWRHANLGLNETATPVFRVEIEDEYLLPSGSIILGCSLFFSKNQRIYFRN